MLYRAVALNLWRWGETRETSSRRWRACDALSYPDDPDLRSEPIQSLPCVAPILALESLLDAIGSCHSRAGFAVTAHTAASSRRMPTPSCMLPGGRPVRARAASANCSYAAAPAH